MIFSENRYTLFRIMLISGSCSAPARMAPGLVPVLPRGIDNAAVSLEELVGHLEDRKDQRAIGTPGNMAAAGLAPDELTGLAFHVLCRTFLVDETALDHIALLDIDVLMVWQHGARREPHQGSHQARGAIEQQRLGFAAGKAGLLPFHLLRTYQVGMLVRGLV